MILKTKREIFKYLLNHANKVCWDVILSAIPKYSSNANSTMMRTKYFGLPIDLQNLDGSNERKCIKEDPVLGRPNSRQGMTQCKRSKLLNCLQIGHSVGRWCGHQYSNRATSRSLCKKQRELAKNAVLPKFTVFYRHSGCNEVDLLLGPMEVNYERSVAFEFSNPIQVSPLVIVGKRPGSEKVIEGFLTPFSTWVEVVRWFAVSQSVVSRMWERYQQTGLYHDRPYSGRPVL
ncbi:hypothetical protein GQR58_019925 [Nymphon striatum]|nr:hypothetical protein GQR58_019925 [Nymphon striatum]